MTETLLIRADASPEIGTGHVMRCLALAQAWQDAGGPALFAFAMESPALEARVTAEGFDCVRLRAKPGSANDARETAELAQAHAAQYVILDGYHFDASYQRSIKENRQRLLVFDDYGHAAHYHADFVLNQNLHASERLYTNRELHTQLLLGPRYAQLRREFWNWREWSRQIPPVGRRVLVTLGGSDPTNATATALDALREIEVEGLEAVVTVGGSNPHWQELERKASGLSASIRLERNTSRMPELMAWADAAVAAGGSTSWELAFMGLPALMLVLAENQRDIAAHLHEAGVALNLGGHDTVSARQIATALREVLTDPRRRKTMSDLGRKLVDGLGSRRVVAALQT